MFEIMSKKDARKYGNQIYKQWRADLLDKEVRSLKRYKFNSKKINQMARKNIDNSDVNNISTALKKAVIDKDIIVIRESHIKFLEANNRDLNTVAVGDKLIEAGFMSAFLFRPRLAFKGKVRLKISVPRGTQGAYINNISFFHRWENEILFDKDMILQVQRKYVKKSKMILEVICL